MKKTMIEDYKGYVIAKVKGADNNDYFNVWRYDFSSNKVECNLFTTTLEKAKALVDFFVSHPQAAANAQSFSK